jgi:hypothetical protein
VIRSHVIQAGPRGARPLSQKLGGSIRSGGFIPPLFFFSLGFASVPAGAGDGEARLHGLRFEPPPGGEDGRSERPPAVSVNVRGTRLQGGFNTSSTRSGGGGNQEVVTSERGESQGSPAMRGGSGIQPKIFPGFG